MKPEKNQPLTGFLLAAGAFLTWGALPIYWSLLFHLPALTILGYRIIWSWAFVSLIILLSGRRDIFRSLLSDRRALLLTVLSGIIINTNWGIYIYTINSGRVMEASMGYYINPLVNALFGALFFGERLRRLQKAAILLVCAGVLYMVLGYGEVPVFALSLAVTFAVYGALHKFVRLGVLDGMFCEMSIAVLPACVYLLFCADSPPFFGQAPLMMLTVALSGPLTALPLMGFAAGVKRLSLTTVGVVQYLSPTITFLCGVFYFREPVSAELLLVFGCIWAGVLLYLFDGIAVQRLHRKRVARA